jgi:hypothetical protein
LFDSFQAAVFMEQAWHDQVGLQGNARLCA